MPRLIRPMKCSNDGKPVIGTESKELGVRIPPNSHADVDLDSNGAVILNRRGLSVASEWYFLLPHLIPKRYRGVREGAAGPNSLSIYRIGSGEFQDSEVNDHLLLALKPGNARHGNIVPRWLMHVAEFQAHLANTRDQWVVEEPA